MDSSGYTGRGDLSPSWKKSYIGDGVYLEWDGFSICASTTRVGQDHYIWFDPDMIKDLVQFLERCQEREEWERKLNDGPLRIRDREDEL